MKTWYVYLLCDPDTEEPFYVGKGAGRRIDQHERSFLDGNIEKHRIIHQIQEQGKQVLKKKIAEFAEEQDAYIYEWVTINMYRERIVNMRPGGNRIRNALPVKKQPLVNLKHLARKEYISIREVAKTFNVAQSTIYSYIKFYGLKIHKFRGRAVLSLADVKKMKAYKEQPWTVERQQEAEEHP